MVKYLLKIIFIFTLSLSFASQNANVDAYIKKAIESEKIGKEKDAIGYLTTAIQLDPKNVIALSERASLFVVFGDYNNALKDYREALKINPTEELYYKTGVAELNAGDDEKAIEHLTSAIKLNPKKEFYYFFRGEAELDLGLYKAAIADFNKAIKIKPDDYRAIYTRGKCYFNVHEYDKAINDFTAAEKMYSYNSDLYYYRGACQFNLSKFEDAITDFSLALSKDSDNHDALINRAISYKYLKNYSKADIDYTKYIALHKVTTQIKYTAANVKYSLSNFVESEKLYSEVIEESPRHKMAYFHRGMARFNQRKMDLACADFKKSKELGYLAGYDQMKGNCK